MKAKYEHISEDHLAKVHFIEAHATNMLISAHWHEHLELVLVTEGRMEASINDRIYKINCGDVFLVNPNDIHYTRCLGETRYFLLQIPSFYLGTVSADRKTLRFQEIYECDTTNDSLPSRLAVMFHEISELYARKENGYHLLVISAIYRLLFLVYTEGSAVENASCADSRTTHDLERIKLCMEFIQTHYSDRIFLKDVADLLAVTPEHFCRLFRKYTGQTFLAYVNQIRMNHFYHDLIESDGSISYLLEKNGIFGYKKFLQTFRQQYGASPQAVRKEHR